MRALGSIAVVLSLSAMGCDKLFATVIGVGITIDTPNPAGAEGLDATLVSRLPSLDQTGVKQAVASAVGLGERESSTSTAAPNPLAGASVKLLWPPSLEVNLCPDADAPGSYAVTNVPGDACGDSALEYLAGAKYTTRIETSDDIYTMDITLPSAINAASVLFDGNTFSTQSVQIGAATFQLETHALNSPMPVDWSTDPAADGKHAFITLVRITHVVGANVDTGWEIDPNNPVHDTFPKSAGAMAELIINAPETKASIPGTAFDAVGLYLLVLTPVEMSESTSDNMMLGSGAFAGTSTIFAFWVE